MSKESMPQDNKEMTLVLPSSATSVEQSRAIQEVQGAILMAKKFPRDENAAFNRVMTSCKRKSLAEVAMYAYPRGGTTVTGASIRLAETIAKAWGNIQCGHVELEQDMARGKSEVMAYAWDLETNTRQVKIFTVPHERHTKKGVTKLTDPRDIYELVANQASRRLRSCIFGVLPGDVIEEAIAQCEKTLMGQSEEPLQDRVRKAVVAFAEFGVTQQMIERRLGHNLDATSVQELVNLQKIYRSLKDSMASVGDFFDMKAGTENLNDEFIKDIKSKPEPPIAENATATQQLAGPFVIPELRILLTEEGIPDWDQFAKAYKAAAETATTRDSIVQLKRKYETQLKNLLTNAPQVCEALMADLNTIAHELAA